MKLYIKKMTGLKIPSQANDTDAGYDVVATTEPVIVGTKFNRPYDQMVMWSRVAYIEYGTNLFVAPKKDIVLSSDHVTDGGGEKPFVLFEVDYHLLLHPRSSISKNNLVLANSIGLVDNGYRNQIMLRFKYIFQPEDLIVVPEAGGTRIYGVVNNDHLYKMGEKVIQLKACPNLNIQFEEVDDLNATMRGMGGFGSSGL